MKKSVSKKEIFWFTTVMLVFMLGMIIMVANNIHSWWIWTIYVIVWTLVEMRVAKNIHLTWWQWLLIIAGLSVIDLIVLRLLG